ncbi:MAG TPA: GNAT family N-acetyltransferase, partial [Bryobacteraceae bacterium]|nr:GNAT family N-acetyltransferase [Bryobacteraceae bacterium]
MASVLIRRATPDDAPAITRVYMESAEHHAAIDPEHCEVPDRTAIEARYRQNHQHPDPESPAITLVAESDGEIVGFLDAQIQVPFDPMLRRTPFCFIADVAVAASHRSQRIGEQLMQAIEKWAHEQNAGFLAIIYNPRNSRVAEY